MSAAKYIVSLDWLGSLVCSFWFCFGLPIAFLFSLLVFALCYLGENLGSFKTSPELLFAEGTSLYNE
jgi:hypothetical protein